MALNDDLKGLAIWLYENSANIPEMAKAREAFKARDVESNDLAADFKVYYDLIGAFDSSLQKKYPQVKSTYLGKFDPIKAQIDAYKRSSNLTVLDSAVEAWKEKENFTKKKALSSQIQALLGLAGGIGLTASVSWLAHNNRTDSSESSDPATLQEVALIVLYFASFGLTLTARLNFYRQINELLDGALDALIRRLGGTGGGERPDMIPSAPFFENFGFWAQLYPAIQHIAFTQGNNPLNWASLVLPPVSLLAGNMVSRGVDNLRTLCRWPASQSTAGERQALLGTTEVDPHLKNVNTKREDIPLVELK